MGIGIYISLYLNQFKGNKQLFYANKIKSRKIAPMTFQRAVTPIHDTLKNGNTRIHAQYALQFQKIHVAKTPEAGYGGRVWPTGP